MGKHVQKKPTFGGNGLFDGLEPKNTETPVTTPTPEYEPTYTHTPTQKKERRNRRMNFLMEPSKAEKLKEYAAKNDVSMNDLICNLVDKFLEENS